MDAKLQDHIEITLPRPDFSTADPWTPWVWIEPDPSRGVLRMHGHGVETTLPLPAPGVPTRMTFKFRRQD